MSPLRFAYLVVALACLASVCITPVSRAAVVAAANVQSVQNGKRLFLAVGCYECHGTTGGGAITGPKLAPNPIPLPAFIYQLRHPLGAPSYGLMRMPAYGTTVLSDAEVSDLFAYLASMKPGPPATQIPLLSR